MRVSDIAGGMMCCVADGVSVLQNEDDDSVLDDINSDSTSM